MALTYTLCLCLLGLIGTGCTLQDEHLETLLVGDWSLVKEIQPNNTKRNRFYYHDFPFSWQGFVFYKGGKCERKTIPPEGFHTYYEVQEERPQLKIWNRKKNDWEAYRVLYIRKDTLALSPFSSETILKYVKEKTDTTVREHYDQIIVSSAGAGTFPIMHISINHNGEVWFYAEGFNDKKGFFKARISPVMYADIERRFEQAQVPLLKDDYSVSGTDQPWHLVTFVQAGKIVKTISNYGLVAPMKFAWAYTAVRALPYKLAYEPFDNRLPTLPATLTGFQTHTQVFKFHASDFFYLMLELHKAKETTQHFAHTYKFRSWDKDDKPNTVYTDGQYYSIHTSQGLKTLDLGYNFFTRNEMSKNVRAVHEYDLKGW